MNAFRKMRTLARLVANAKGREITRRWTQFVNLRRVRKHEGQSFVYEDLGFPVVCHPDWRESLDWFIDCKSDVKETQLAAAWLEPGDSCIDVGANLGLYAFCFSHIVGPRGEVLAVDADELIIDRLKRAALLLRAAQIHTMMAAVSDCSGEVSFFVDTRQSKTQEQSLVLPAGGEGAFQAVRVPAVTFGEVLQQLQTPEKLSLVKVDIEGAESLAFRSVPKQLLDAEGPMWMLELNPEALSRFGSGPRDITDKFDARQFDVWLVPQYPRTSDPQQAAARKLAPSEKFEGAAFYNLIAIPLGSRWQRRRKRTIGIVGNDE